MSHGQRPPPDDPRRRRADELARELATDDGLAAARRGRARLSERLSPSSARPDIPRPAADEPAAETAPPSRADSAPPRPISIWQPRASGAAGTVWVRPLPTPLGDHYAARRELRPRRPGGPRRVAWFGESAAAGYLYAPHLTPASLLQERLTAADGEGPGWEVIDLARTNERLETLAATVEAAAQLSPDVLVILTGNNWRLLEAAELSPWAPRVAARRELADALAAEGPTGVARLARRRTAESAARALERVAAVAAELAVPVVLLLPEVNLADWETRQPPVRLASDGTARWHHLYRCARAALAAGDGTTAEDLAWQMVELDGGLNPTPFRLLAAAAAAAGRTRDARDAAISEVDAVHSPLLACLAAPQAGNAERRVLELAGRRHGWQVADLRPVFAEHSGGALPGRRLFLDYCHFSAEGLGLVAAVAAARVLHATGRPAAERSWRELAAAPQVEPAVEAVAQVGAAVHTAHRHLPVTDRRQLLADACRRALEADPAAATAALLDLADARTGGLPELLSAAQARQWARSVPLTLQHGWRWPHLDGDLLRAAAGTLEAFGREEAAELERLLSRRALPAAGRGPTDLLHPQPHGLAEPVARFLPEAMAAPGLAERATLRSPWPETAFDLVLPDGWATTSGGIRELEVELVARLPEGNGGEVTLGLDGGASRGVRLDGTWQRGTLRLPVARLDGATEGVRTAVPDLRRLTVRWPAPPPAEGDPLAAAIHDLGLGRETDLHPVFGEIQALRVRPL